MSRPLPRILLSAFVGLALVGLSSFAGDVATCFRLIGCHCFG